MFIGIEGTCYEPDNYYPDTICYSIDDQINSTNKFKLFEIVKEDTVFSFNNWNDFLAKYVETYKSKYSDNNTPN